MKIPANTNKKIFNLCEELLKKQKTPPVDDYADDYDPVDDYRRAFRTNRRR
jgi:hypothetical protein